MESSRRWRWLASVILILWVEAGKATLPEDSIDVGRPVARRSPTTNETFFGYAVTLHQVQEPPVGGFSANIEATRIIVGAPRGTFPGGLEGIGTGNPVSGTGLVYQCPVTPGTCTGMFGNGVGNDRRLFDDEPDASDEEKSGQFMGGTLASSGHYFFACAHRWVSLSNISTAIDKGRPHGRCFISGRNLTEFEILRPCRSAVVGTTFGDNLCSAGIGAALISDTYAVIGGPGYYRERGQVYAFNLSDSNFTNTFMGNHGGSRFDFSAQPVGVPDNIYDGYTLATGRIVDRDTLDVISAAPRFNGTSYIGRASVLRPDRIETSINVFAEGTQNGEYFGWAIAAADLNGDRYDELLVGAPMFSNVSHPEQGRVYVFNNTGGNLSDTPVILSGNTAAFSRFGSSIVNLGDVNDDGYEDVAIGAPFDPQSENANGTVLIYLGSPTDLINSTAHQTITARDVMRLVGMNQLKTFGYSLASGVDVDGNQFNDLLVGAFDSQVAVLFRTRSLAYIVVNATTDVSTLDVNQLTCPRNRTNHACFIVTVCATYRGRGLQGTLESNLILTERRTVANEDRLLFYTEGSLNMYNESFIFPDNGVQRCLPITTYVRDPDVLIDERTPFQLDINFEEPFRENRNVDGNQSLVDFTTIPRIRTSGTSSVSVEPVVLCDEDSDPDNCISDLQLTLHNITFRVSDSMRTIVRSGDPNQLVADQASIVEVYLNYTNLFEPAFGPTISFTLDPLLRHSSASLVTANLRDIRINCEQTIGTNYTCNLPSPARRQDGVTQIVLIWQLRRDLVGNEVDLVIPFEIGISGIPGNEERNIGNNMITATIEVVAIADLRISSISFTEMPPMYTGDDPRQSNQNLTQGDLGNQVVLSVLVANDGPSTADAILDIYIPSSDSNSNGLFYIYPASHILLQVTPPLSVTCDTSNLNPEGLAPPGQQTAGRRRRSVPLPDNTSGGRYKRQTPAGSNVKNCSNSIGRSESCTQIRCTISGFASTRFTVRVMGYLDERFYSGQTDPFTFVGYAEVRSREDFVTDPNPNNNNGATAAYTVTRREQPTGDGSVPAWIPIVAVIGALLLLIPVVVILYFVGFFRRKRHPKAGTQEAEGDFEVPTVTGATEPGTGKPAVEDSKVEGEGEGEGKEEGEGEGKEETENPEEAENPEEKEKDPDETSL